MTEALDALLTLQERDGALDRLRHRHQTLPERETLTRGEADAAALEARWVVARSERDEVARQEQKLDDEARLAGSQGHRGRGQDVLG